MNNHPNKIQSWFQVNLDIVKRHVWSNPLFPIYLLRKVVKYIMDEQIKLNPKNMDIPMGLINIYERIERDLKRCSPLVLRLKYYANYSAKLYTYIKLHLGKDMAHRIFVKARKRILFDKKLMVKFKVVPSVVDQNKRMMKKIGVPQVKG